MTQAFLDTCESDVILDFFTRNTDLVSDAHVRKAVGSHLANALNIRIPRMPGQATRTTAALAPVLGSEGFVPLGVLLQPDDIAATVAAARALPCYDREIAYQGDGIPRYVGAGAEQRRLGGYRMQDVVELPHLLELALSPTILSVAEAYMNATPTLTMLSAWWSFPCVSEPQPFPQNFHRDSDDFRFVSLFVYLTDVGLGSGPHQYVRGSHDLDRFAETARGLFPTGRNAMSYFDGLNGIPERNTEYLDTFAPLMATIVGPAGVGFLGDNYGLHRGMPPIDRPRLLFVARYGLFRNANEEHRLREGYQRVPWSRRLPDLPADDWMRYITRLILEPPAA